MNSSHRHVAIVGPTASGKSAVALELARRAGYEIVSVDAMQVYRGMDIGTAKPTPAERAEVPHHMIDVADPGEDYTVARYQREAARALAAIEDAGTRALLVGGTGLYVRALVDRLEIPGRFPDVRSELEAERDATSLHARLRRLDPVAAGRIEPGNRRRLVRALEVTLGSGRPFSSYGPGLETYPPTDIALYGLRTPRAVLDERIDARYDEQLAAGFVDEVRRLQRGPLSRTARQALGYKELLEHLGGTGASGTPEAALEPARARTKRFARRQERWFRRDPRIRWIDVERNPLTALGILLEEST